jgi:hypothetical protein
MKMTAIRFTDVRKWMLQQYEIHSVNPATINRFLATLKVMMKEAVGYILFHNKSFYERQNSVLVPAKTGL